MKNVYDIKCEKNLNYILPMNLRLEKCQLNVEEGETVIVVHLHYIDTLNHYLKYIDCIPEYIDVIFTVSDEKAEKALQETILTKKNNCLIIRKQNRGRDISSLLVACREKILKYKYVCFVHDKKPKNDFYKKDVDLWIQCLWENMLGSEEYIDNIRMILSKEKTLGILTAPTPLSDNFSIAYDNTWYGNFELTKKLTEQMQLDCNLDPKKAPITIGTVLWAKVEAIKKLLEIEWKYEDFDPEPLKNDGTISHAIERVFAYVAQDAGFETGWVMTEKYASERFEYMQVVLKKAFDRLNKSLGIRSISELNSFESRRQKLLSFCRMYEYIYIYGAGVYGRSCLALMESEHQKLEAFIITNNEQKNKQINSIPIYNVEQVMLNQKCGVIVAANSINRSEILKEIKKRFPEFFNIYIYDTVSCEGE